MAPRVSTTPVTITAALIKNIRKSGQVRNLKFWEAGGMSEGLSLRSLGSRRSQGEDLRIHEISVRRTGTVALGRKVTRTPTPTPNKPKTPGFRLGSDNLVSRS
jgi:hypothetical protein